MVRYGALFSGAGLLDWGLHRTIPSLDCRWAVEVDTDRRAIFGAHFPSARMMADIWAIDPGALPHVDGLIGGVPCSTHSTANTAGERGLAPEWKPARDIIEHTKPAWTLWESSGKQRTWTYWVPAVRRDLWDLGHASMCFRLRTSGRFAPHERERAFVISWAKAFDSDGDRKPAVAIHAQASSLREAPGSVWDGWVPPRAHGRLDDGVDGRLARAVGLGVDRRTAEDAGRILGALIRVLTPSAV